MGKTLTDEELRENRNDYRIEEEGIMDVIGSRISVLRNDIFALNWSHKGSDGKICYHMWRLLASAWDMLSLYQVR